MDKHLLSKYVIKSINTIIRYIGDGLKDNLPSPIAPFVEDGVGEIYGSKRFDN